VVRFERAIFLGVNLQKVKIAAVVLAMTASISAAFAGEISDHAAEADKLLQSGDPTGALEQFRSAEAALWAAMPLTVLNVKQVDSALGYGVYTERSNQVYKPGEKILLYLEPVGYGYGADGLGNIQIALSLDLTVFSVSGEKIGTWKNIGRIRVASHRYNRELFFKLSISLNGVEKGKYRAAFVLHDETSKKMASFTTNFEIAG
jgi:hypothetical protein